MSFRTLLLSLAILIPMSCASVDEERDALRHQGPRGFTTSPPYIALDYWEPAQGGLPIRLTVHLVDKERSDDFRRYDEETETYSDIQVYDQGKLVGVHTLRQHDIDALEAADDGVPVTIRLDDVSDPGTVESLTFEVMVLRPGYPSPGFSYAEGTLAPGRPAHR